MDLLELDPFLPASKNAKRVLIWSQLIINVLALLLMIYHSRREQQRKREPRCDPTKSNLEKGHDDTESPPAIITPPSYNYWKEEIFWRPGERFVFLFVMLETVHIFWMLLMEHRGRCMIALYAVMMLYMSLMGKVLMRFRFRGVKLWAWQALTIAPLPLWLIYPQFDLGLPGQSFIFGEGWP